MSVTIINKSRPPRAIVIPLPHEEYCEKLGKCECDSTEVTEPVRDPNTGEFKKRKYMKRITSSWRIGSRETKTGQPEALLMVEQIKKEIRNGSLKIIEEQSKIDIIEKEVKTSIEEPKEEPKEESKEEPKLKGSKKEEGDDKPRKSSWRRRKKVMRTKKT